MTVLTKKVETTFIFGILCGKLNIKKVNFLQIPLDKDNKPAKIKVRLKITLLKFMYIHRELEKRILPFLNRREAISIIGPRQAGKTTLLKYLSEKLESENKKVKFITFENREDLSLFQDSIDDFKALYANYDYLIIDEFQYARDGGQKLKYLYDTTNVKYIISGSSSLDLIFQTGKYMVGRMIDFELRPFSFREYLSYIDKDLFILVNKIDKNNFVNFPSDSNGFSKEINRRLNRKLENFVLYGGYPAVILSKNNDERIEIIKNILQKYLLRDIKGLLNLATDEELIKLAKFLSTQIGNIVKYEELATAADLTYAQLLKHLNILKNTFIINLVKPFFTNKRRELVKRPKCYFLDLGLRNSLINDFRPLKIRSDTGAMMENYAYNMINSLNIGSELKFWRTKSMAEVDFVIEKNQKIIPIEVKYSSKRIIGKSFYSFLEKYNSEVGIILTKDYLAEEKIKKATIKFIPLSYF